ncbi:hypothetical protein Tco_0322719 [Tanacetum coccineum]
MSNSFSALNEEEEDDDEEDVENVYDESANLIQNTKAGGSSSFTAAAEPYTIFHKPRGVVYLNKSKEKRLMRADELYKFSDGTLHIVHDNLHAMMHNFKLGYNDAMPKRKWSEKDQEQIAKMLKLIDDLLLERRIMRSLECYVGGRLNETDYRLWMRTI